VAELQNAIGAPIDVAVAPALVDVGPAWLVARLDSAERLLALQPNMHRLAALEVGLGATGTTLFAASASVGNDVEVRSFAPSIGVTEDPVCGSGNGSVAAFRRERGCCPPSSSITWPARDGVSVEMVEFASRSSPRARSGSAGRA
jgi:PhzF family phenazine biosynthesis protein